MANLFKLDGQEYDVGVIKLERNVNVLDRYAERSSSSGLLYRDVIGCFLGYKLSFVRITSQNLASEYTRLFEKLSSSDKYHEITVPYNQTTVTYTAYISSVSDELMRVLPSGINVWGNLSAEFIARSPYKKG